MVSIFCVFFDAREAIEWRWGASLLRFCLGYISKIINFHFYHQFSRATFYSLLVTDLVYRIATSLNVIVSSTRASVTPVTLVTLYPRRP